MAGDRDDAKWEAYHDTVLELHGTAAGGGLLRIDLRRPDLGELAWDGERLGLEPGLADRAREALPGA